MATILEVLLYIKHTTLQQMVQAFHAVTSADLFPLHKEEEMGGRIPTLLGQFLYWVLQILALACRQCSIVMLLKYSSPKLV